MKSLIGRLLASLVVGGLLAAAGVVSGAHAAGKKSPPSDVPTGGLAEAPADSVWVFRLDGAKSCTPKSGQTLESVQQELVAAKIHVQDARKGSDGKMHMQLCGAETGSQNTFLIPRAELPMAEALGFHALPKQK